MVTKPKIKPKHKFLNLIQHNVACVLMTLNPSFSEYVMHSKVRVSGRLFTIFAVLSSVHLCYPSETYSAKTCYLKVLFDV